MIVIVNIVKAGISFNLHNKFSNYAVREQMYFLQKNSFNRSRLSRLPSVISQYVSGNFAENILGNFTEDLSEINFLKKSQFFTIHIF